MALSPLPPCPPTVPPDSSAFSDPLWQRWFSSISSALAGRLPLAYRSGSAIPSEAAGLVFGAAIPSASAPLRCLFVDSADQKLKFKDSAGVVNLLY